MGDRGDVSDDRAIRFAHDLLELLRHVATQAH
jgi:hypothetical protein